MAQALYENLNTTITTPVGTSPADMTLSENKETTDFDNILNSENQKVQDSNEVKTIGDIKAKSSIDTTSKLDKLKNALAEAEDEINMENALDLTLTRDINDIIINLKDTLSQKIKDNSDDKTDEKIDEENIAFSIIEPKLESTIEFQNLTTTQPTVMAETQEAAETVVKPQIEIEEPENEESLNLDEDMITDLNIEVVDSESENQQNFAQNGESFEEHSAKLMINGVNDKFEVNTPVKTTETKPAEITPSKIIEQVTKQLESMSGGSKVNIVLNPESLGKVSLQIMNTQGGLSASFTVSSNEVRDILMKGIDGLKESLLAQGVAVDNINIKVAESEESSYNPDWTEQENSNSREEQNPKHKNKDDKEFTEIISKSIESEKEES